MTGLFKFKGMVCTGRGEGARFTELPWFKEQVRRKLRFNPEPGTLNIKLLSEEDVAALKLLRSAEWLGVKMEPPEGCPCGGLSFKARLRKVGDEWWAHAYVIIPLVDHYYRDVVELIAPANLRRALKLRDLDEVELRVEPMVNEALRIKALLLDLEGTLVDSARLSLEVVGEALAKHGATGVDLEAIRMELSRGSSLPLAISTAAPHLPRGEVARIVEEARLLWRRRRREVSVARGAASLLREAKGRFSIAIVTDLDLEPSFVYSWLKELGLDGFIDAVSTRRCVGLMKPSPLPLLYACKLLGVDPEECLFIGDSVADVKAGKLAGCLTCGLPTGVALASELADECPDLLVRDLHELLSALKELKLM